MKALQLQGDKRLGFVDIDRPRIRSDQLLIRPHYVSICGTDIHIYRGEFKCRVKYPTVLGHEFSGVVAEVGQDVEGCAIGDRVVVDPKEPCGRCPACLHQRSSGCFKLVLTGVDRDGGMAEFVSVRAAKVFKLPDNVALEAAPLIELYAVSIHAMRRAVIEAADTVVILGAGRLGLVLLDTVKELGPSQIIVCDIRDYRLDIARKMGAHHCINSAREDPVARVCELTDGLGAAKVFEAVGHSELPPGAPQPMTQAVEMICSAGRVIVLGQGTDAAPITFKPFVLREGEIIASRVNAGEFPQAIRYMSEGRYHPELLITHRMGIDEAPNAFRLLDDGEEAIKVMLKVW